MHACIILFIEAITNGIGIKYSNCGELFSFSLEVKFQFESVFIVHLLASWI